MIFVGCNGSFVKVQSVRFHSTICLVTSDFSVLKGRYSHRWGRIFRFPTHSARGRSKEIKIRTPDNRIVSRKFYLEIAEQATF